MNINIYKIAWMILGTMLISSCASTDVKDSATSAYQAYFQACQTNDEEKAKQMLDESDAFVCPDEQLTETFPTDPEFVLIAKNANTLILESNGWKLSPTVLPYPNESTTVIYQLKYVLKNHNSKQFLAMMNDDIAGRYAGLTDDTMAASAELNDLYASLAATRIPWFRYDSTHAYFEIPDWKITFEWMNDKWVLIELKRYE